MALHPERDDIPGPGLEEYAEKALTTSTAPDPITDAEARAIALQGIVELSQGIKVAVAEIRVGRFMAAAESLLLAQAGCVVAEAAIQKIRTSPAALSAARREAKAAERARWVAEVEALLASPDDTQQWPDWDDKDDENAVVDVQVVNLARLRVLVDRLGGDDG